MARNHSPNDFEVVVPNVGRFVFAHRTMRDEIAIQVAYAKMIDGAQATQWLQVICGILAALEVLTVVAPDGWDVHKLDPLSDNSYKTLVTVFDALSEKESSFRRNS